MRRVLLATTAIRQAPNLLVERAEISWNCVHGALYLGKPAPTTNGASPFLAKALRHLPLALDPC